MTLASGTAIGQLLLFLAVPVLTRIYSPTDYGALAVFSSTLQMLVVVASLRYEFAIPLPEEEDVARSLLGLTFLVLTATTSLVTLLVWLVGDAYVSAVNVPALRPYLWLIPVGFLGAGAYQAISFWAIRRREFNRVARTKLSQGLGQVLAQVGLGFAGLGVGGLLIGDVVGRVAGGGGLLLLALRERGRARITPASLGSVIRRYRRFPLLTTWAGLLAIAGLQLPSIVFAAGFGVAAAGLYGLSYKMLVLPTMLVGHAVHQVFLSRAAMVARDPGRLRQLTERTALALFAGGLPVFGVVALGGPQLFGTVMGREWEPAGRYAQVLAPWFVGWLVAHPLSGLFTVREWQASALAFTASEFALRLGALLLGIRLGSPLLAVGLISAAGLIISIISVLRFMHAGYSSIRRILAPAARLCGLATLCLIPVAIALLNHHERLAIVAGVLTIAAYYGVLLRSHIAPRFLQVDLRSSGTAP